jgi:hypothetical protein
MDLFTLFLLLYFLPTTIALCRSHRSAGGIFVVNLLVGWTLLGWVWSLAWACAYAGENQNPFARLPKQVGFARMRGPEYEANRAKRATQLALIAGLAVVPVMLGIVTVLSLPT